MRTSTAIGLLVVVGAAASTAFGQASFTLSGYSQNFDSMGTGTAAPTGWKHFVTSFGTNATWTSSIPASGANSVASMPVGTAATTLTAATNPSGQNNNGFNAGVSGSTTNRALAASPTTVAGAILQLQLSNDTGVSYASGEAFTVSFDTIRYTAVSSQNELPGYALFISLDAGATWTNILPNPTSAQVPNTVGVTARTANFNLPAAWASGSLAYIRWVDDNAAQTSPDQIIGLDNVSIVPTPGSVALLGLGALAVGRRRR